MIFDVAKERIRVVPRVCDIGPGIRPMPFFKPEEHICIEPHAEYADWLEERGFPVIRSTALAGLSILEPVDSIFMLDVIEHMSKEEGRLAVQAALSKAKEQVVVFTPLGFKQQSYQAGDKDAWGMNGTYWQTHRSGWEPEEFIGWQTIVEGGGFFAIHG